MYARGKQFCDWQKKKGVVSIHAPRARIWFSQERENFTTKTLVAKKRHHKYSLLTAGAKKANRQESLHALQKAAGVGCRQTTSRGTLSVPRPRRILGSKEETGPKGLLRLMIPKHSKSRVGTWEPSCLRGSQPVLSCEKWKSHKLTLSDRVPRFEYARPTGLTQNGRPTIFT